jgi:hypothetical protein
MNSQQNNLVLDWCSHAAAKYAVEHWHYSGTLPTPPLVKIGVWEYGKFIGVVLFGRGATPNMLKPYGLQQPEGCELTRIALSKHITPVTRIIRIAIKMLQNLSTGLRILVSYADPNQGHHGGIYQAANWTYTGSTPPGAEYRDAQGRIWHSRQVSASGVTKQYGVMRAVPRLVDCEKIALLGKYRYLWPLDSGIKQLIKTLRLPYPSAIKRQ